VEVTFARGPAGVLADEPLGGPAAAVWPVSDASQVGEVRRAGAAAALAAGLGETERGALAVVVTEIATNLARHATGGRVLLATVGEPGAAGIEVLALDAGPGIANVDRALTDGFSTGGTPGNGLGAIRRLAHEFDLYTQPSGTALVARVWSAAARRVSVAPKGPAGTVCVAIAGERACGDAWLVLRERDRTLVVVADGLGHGPEAAVASTEAVRVVRDMSGASPLELMHAAHAALRPTRGAALAIAALPADGTGAGTLRFAGVGNVAAAVHAGGASRSLASHNGTVGHATRTVQEFAYDWPAGAALVVHTDGLTSRWRLDSYPGVLRHDPALLAGVLFRDAARGRDDATVVVVRAAT
jgi:anti-sigma regulatory factor (Ser/Thr protein kinase)